MTAVDFDLKRRNIKRQVTTWTPEISAARWRCFEAVSGRFHLGFFGGFSEASEGFFLGFSEAIRVDIFE